VVGAIVGDRVSSPRTISPTTASLVPSLRVIGSEFVETAAITAISFTLVTVWNSIWAMIEPHSNHTLTESLATTNPALSALVTNRFVIISSNSATVAPFDKRSQLAFRGTSMVVEAAGAGDNVVEMVGEIVGESVGDVVGETVGDKVGETVGDKVGSETVGNVVVGDVVGDLVGDLVGDPVGVIVGASMLSVSKHIPPICSEVSVELVFSRLTKARMSSELITSGSIITLILSNLLFCTTSPQPAWRAKPGGASFPTAALPTAALGERVVFTPPPSIASTA